MGAVQYVYMDIDKFPEIAELLEIKHIPQTFMIHKGELVDQIGGVPKDQTKLLEFFSRAKGLAASDGASDNTMISMPSGLKIEILSEGEGPKVP